jgi:hypothetical protein
MVAYSFRPRFVDPIRAGSKRQTIRAERKRHARPGEELQLYTGMRTRQCKLIGRAKCQDVIAVTLLFNDADSEAEGVIAPGFVVADGRDAFAHRDGFATWSELKAFWRVSHPGIDEFTGVLITWGPLL